jgi:hypothetical protein
MIQGHLGYSDVHCVTEAKPVKKILSYLFYVHERYRSLTACPWAQGGQNNFKIFTLFS